MTKRKPPVDDEDNKIKLFPARRKWVDMNAYTFANIVLDAQQHGKLDELMAILEKDHVTVTADTVNETKLLLHNSKIDQVSPFARTIVRLDPGKCRKRPHSPRIG